MPANLANEEDISQGDYLTEPPVETENLLAQEHVRQKRRHSNRVHSLSWAAQSVVFLASITILYHALSLKRTDPTTCVQKHSLFCEQYQHGGYSTDHALMRKTNSSRSCSSPR